MMLTSRSRIAESAVESMIMTTRSLGTALRLYISLSSIATYVDTNTLIVSD